MPYRLSMRFDWWQSTQILDLIRKSVKEDLSFNTFEKTAKEAGLGYRRETMQYDYRYAQAFEHAKTLESSNRAAEWFDTIFEPLRAKNNWNSAQTTEFLQKGSLGILPTIEEQLDYEHLLEKQHAIAPDKYQ